MSILADIKAKQTEARKARNTEVATILTTLYSEVANIGLNDGKRETTDAEAIKKVKSAIDNAKTCISVLPENSDKANGYYTEIVVLEGFVPQQLTEQELVAKVEEFFVSLKDKPSIPGASNPMPLAMAYFKSNFAGLYDGGTLSKIVKQHIQALADAAVKTN